MLLKVTESNRFGPSCLASLAQRKQREASNSGIIRSTAERAGAVLVIRGTGTLACLLHLFEHGLFIPLCGSSLHVVPYPDRTFNMASPRPLDLPIGMAALPADLYIPPVQHTPSLPERRQEHPHGRSHAGKLFIPSRRTAQPPRNRSTVSRAPRAPLHSPLTAFRRRTSVEVLLNPLIISRNESERVLVEPSINSIRISIAIKQADEIERILCKKFTRFMTMRAENFVILRRKPVEVSWPAAAGRNQPLIMVGLGI